MWTRARKCYVCGAELEREAIPMQDSYRGAKSKRMYVPQNVQAWCPRGHKVEIGLVVPEDLGH